MSEPWWANPLRLSVDDVYEPATVAFPRHGLRAEFWVSGVIGRFDDDLTKAGTYRYVATDQLRFHRIGDPPSTAHAVSGSYAQTREPVPLAAIPRFVLSEVTRDLELFVAVSTVATDPYWEGRDGPLKRYWEDMVFGPLRASGRTRRAVLARVLPSLDIAERCALDDRFVRVRGSDGRDYEIHLGTANVRDEDREAVGVGSRRRGRGSGPALPFEGDAALVAILTRAHALATDAEQALATGRDPA